MAEEIIVASQRFDQSESKKEGEDLSVDVIEQGIDECRLSLIDKIIGKKVANFIGVKNFTSHVWIYPRHLR